MYFNRKDISGKYHFEKFFTKIVKLHVLSLLYFQTRIQYIYMCVYTWYTYC